MNSLPGAHTFLDVSWYPKRDDERTFYYLPGAPVPERDGQGRPTLQLWEMGGKARLQFGVRLTVEGEVLESLRREIASVMGLSNPAVIRLAPAPFSVTAVEFVAHDGEGRDRVLDSRTSSGYPPFNTLFNVSLDEPHAARAEEAIRGGRDLLKVRYALSLPVEVTAQSTVEGDVRADIEALASGPTAEVKSETISKRGGSQSGGGSSTYQVEEYYSESSSSSSSSTTIIRRHTSGGGAAAAAEEPRRQTISLEQCRARVERALQEGRLRLTRAGDAEAPGALVEEADEEAREKAAGRLLDMITTSAQPQRAGASLTATAARTAEIRIPLTRSADISSWFAAGDAADHIRRTS
jgi:hypothetical protein